MPEPLPAHVAALAAELAALPGAVVVALGGSRAAGAHRPDSDWDIGLYYRPSVRALDPSAVRALGHEGHVSALGEWGPVMNGGAWLTIQGTPVDIVYRDLDLVERWAGEAEHGRFEVLMQNGSLAGTPTYLSVGELAVWHALHGELPRPVYTGALAAAASERWMGKASLSLMFAQAHAKAADAVSCTGMLAHAVLCASHARLARRREWALGEKRLVERAGLAATQVLLSRPGASEAELSATVEGVGRALGAKPLAPR